MEKVFDTVQDTPSHALCKLYHSDPSTWDDSNVPPVRTATEQEIQAHLAFASPSTRLDDEAIAIRKACWEKWCSPKR